MQLEHKIITFAIVTFSVIISHISAQYQPNWESLDKRPLPVWYDEAKFGIFVVWGLYSVPSFNNEWFWYRWKAQKVPAVVEFMEKNYPPGFTYPDFAPMFKAELFEPEKWATLFQNSGAKYVNCTLYKYMLLIIIYNYFSKIVT